MYFGPKIKEVGVVEDKTIGDWIAYIVLWGLITCLILIKMVDLFNYLQDFSNDMRKKKITIDKLKTSYHYIVKEDKQPRHKFSHSKSLI